MKKRHVTPVGYRGWTLPNGDIVLQVGPNYWSRFEHTGINDTYATALGVPAGFSHMCDGYTLRDCLES